MDACIVCGGMYRYRAGHCDTEAGVIERTATGGESCMLVNIATWNQIETTLYAAGGLEMQIDLIACMHGKLDFTVSAIEGATASRTRSGSFGRRHHLTAPAEV